MKRGVWFRGVVLLVLVSMAIGLGACSRSAAEREGATTVPAATSVVSPEESPEASPMPGETVVSVVTPVTQTPEADVEPTAEEGGEGVEPPAEPTAEPTSTPTPTSRPTSGGQDGVVVHVVQRGETLYSIARKYGTTYQAIVRANNIQNPSVIYVGQRIKVPTSGSSSGGTSACRYRHTVQRGEWLWQIAREYGVSPYTIMSANGLSLPSASTIYAGMVLCIP